MIAGLTTAIAGCEIEDQPGQRETEYRQEGEDREDRDDKKESRGKDSKGDDEKEDNDDNG